MNYGNSCVIPTVEGYLCGKDCKCEPKCTGNCCCPCACVGCEFTISCDPFVCVHVLDLSLVHVVISMQCVCVCVCGVHVCVCACMRACVRACVMSAGHCYKHTCLSAI